LIDNSLKFTYFGNVEFGYDIIDNNIIIYVNDTGIGISEEFKNKIFQAFSQENISISRSHEGAGLGLSIVKGLVDLVKGNITIDSKQGQGTCIRINIPLKSINDDSPISTLSIKQILKEKVMNNKKILIVEDDKINFIFLQRILISNFNSEILHASDGEKAIEIFRDNPDIDVVLMDLKLPKVDGLTASKEILKINPSIPIIAVTAFANPESHTLAIDAGCKSVIVKPYEAEDLFKAIYKVLKEIGVKKS